MDDLISRQAAINKILGQPPEPHYPSWYAEQIKELPSAQPEPCEDAVSRLEIVRNLHKYFKEGFEQDKWWNSGHVIHAIMDAPSVTPKQRTGKWILDRSGAYCCSECMEPCATYFMMKPRDKFCKMCGAKMEETT